MEGGHHHKRKLKIDFESSKKMKIYHSSTIEQIGLRFPSLEDKILNKLEFQSVLEFTTASKDTADIKQRSRCFWVRRIQYQLGRLYKGNIEAIPEEWRKVIQRSPVEIVKNLSQIIQQFYSFSTKNKYCIVKCSPIHIAAERGDLELCQHIIDKIEDKNPKDLFGETPLHWAVQESHYQVCELFFEKIDDRNPKDIEGVTPLHTAARKGDLELCKLIILNVEDKDPKDKFEETPLHKAAISGNFDVCKLILGIRLGALPFITQLEMVILAFVNY